MILLPLFLLATEAHLGWVFVVDDAGPDDLPTQSDMTKMGFNKANPAYAEVMWSWDDTNYTGLNISGDGCSLWDMNKNGKADFALCVRINTNVTTGLVTHTLTQLFDCRDTQQLNCPTDSQPGFVDASNHTQMYPTANGTGTKLKSTCWIDFQTDPFANVGSHSIDPQTQNATHDSRARCRLYYDELKQGAYPNGLNQPGDPQLINVCSYPSSLPTSNFKDCVVAPGTGFLVINKWTNQAGNCTNYTAFGAACGVEGEAVCTLYNCSGIVLNDWNFTIASASVTKSTSVKGWGWTPLVPMTAGTYSLSEGTMPSGWVQIGFRCADGQTNSSAVAISSGQTLVCYFVNFEGNRSTFENIYGNVTNGTFGNLTLEDYAPTRTYSPTMAPTMPPACPPELTTMFVMCVDSDFSAGCTNKCANATIAVEAAFVNSPVAFQDNCLVAFNDVALVLNASSMDTISLRVNAVPQQHICSAPPPTTGPPTTGFPTPAPTPEVSGTTCLGLSVLIVLVPVFAAMF